MAADKKFNQFTSGGVMQVGDQVVGLRPSDLTKNYIFDFPGNGIKDANGNYLLQYATTGILAKNFPKLINSLTGNPVIYTAEGLDVDIPLELRPKGAAGLILDELNWPLSDGLPNSFMYTDGLGNLGFTSGSVIDQVLLRVFTTSGSYIPTVGMKFCISEVIGAGGGGGGAATSGAVTAAVGGAGGAGGYSRRRLSAAQIGVSQVVTIGAAGTAGTAGNNSGGNGGTTSLGALISATGGIGGTGGAAVTSGAYPGGAGGSGASGDFNTTGNPGATGFSNGLLIMGGNGGTVFFGGGAIAIANTAGTGNAATSYGGGGSGGVTSNSAAQAGGAGRAGIIVITEFIGV